jgi:hypothetical protein
MTTNTHESPTYVFGRRDRGGLLLGFRAPQLLLFGLGAGAVLLGFLSGGGQGGLIGLSVCGAAAAAAVFPIQGRPLVDWVRPVTNYFYQRATGQGRYLGGHRALHRARYVPRLDLPGLARSLRVHEAMTSNGPVAVLKLRDRWTVVVQVLCPNYVLADRASQERRVAAWGALLSQCGQEGSRIAGLQWLERTIPDTGRGLREWWEKAGNPASAYADAYQRLIERAGPTATKHETYLAVSFDARRIRRLVRQAGGGPEGAAKVVLAELAWIRQALARADLDVRGELAPLELGRLVRTQYDPSSPGDEFVRFSREKKSPAIAAGPMAAEAEWSRYRTDSGLHVVYWIAEWPSVPVEAAWCYPLLALSGVRRTVSVSAVPIPPSKSLRDLRSQRVAKRADEAQRRRLGQIETAQDDEELDALQRRELELVRGHTEYRFTGWITVTADTIESLDAACALVEQSAVRSALVVRRVYGEVDQAFTVAALPLNEGVRR